ncbi:uncharacterized, partial [Tachysurus ichikawai]
MFVTVARGIEEKLRTYIL